MRARQRGIFDNRDRRVRFTEDSILRLHSKRFRRIRAACRALCAGCESAADGEKDQQREPQFAHKSPELSETKRDSLATNRLSRKFEADEIVGLQSMRRQAPDYSGAAPLEYLGRSERCRASTA